MYVQRQRRWSGLFLLGDALQEREPVTELMVADEIAQYRAEKKARRQ